MKIKRNDLGKKGFTLVELLVALLISGMLMATVTSVFLMSQKIYTRGGDISYKQKSITNVETDLQNALSRAMAVTLSDDPNGDYNLGFDAVTGKCIEKIGAGGETYVVDQISQISLQTERGTMKYSLVPKDTSMSTLNAGIVMNNSSKFDTRTFSSPVELDNTETLYLVINYGS